MAADKIAANHYTATSDPDRIVEYRAGGAFLTSLPLFLFLFAAGLTMLVFGDLTGVQTTAGWVLIAAGPTFLGLGLRTRRPNAAPLLILAPQGLALRTGGWGVLAVPWSAIEAVESRSFAGFALRYRARQQIVFDDVTMIRLAAGHLAAERDAGHFVPRGPTVDWVVRPDGDGEWIALHHEGTGLTPAEIRGPVEVRWRAFRDRAAAPDGSALPPLRLGGFRPGNPVLFGLGTAAGVVAILIPLFNLAGLWETSAQAETRVLVERLEREDAAARAEAEERDRRWDEMWRDFDESFRIP